jgi:hypothetical protein
MKHQPDLKQQGCHSHLVLQASILSSWPTRLITLRVLSGLRVEAPPVMLGSITAGSTALLVPPLLLLQVRVVRGGVEATLSCFDLLVGDVLLVEAGDILPADGLLFAGGPLK